MTSPLWGPRVQGGFGSSNGGFSSPWSSRGSGQSGGSGGAPNIGPTKPDTGATPGTYGINPIDPAGSATKAAGESANFLDGLKNALFGLSTPDAAGKHGGLVGDLPGAELLRFGSESIANWGGAVASVPGRVADTVGGALEHVDTTSQFEQVTLRSQFAKLPDSEAKQKALERIKNDPGAAGHYMSQAVRDNEDSLSAINPNLYSGMVSTPGSAADAVTNMFGVLGLGQRTVERGIAGAGRPGSMGMNQLQVVQAVAEGRAVFQAGDAGLSPVEQLTYERVKNKDWTEAEGLDFLSSHGAGLSHDQLTEIAGSFATDPLNAAALVGSAFSAVGKAGATVRAIDQAGATLRVPGSAAKLNVLGKLAETQGGTELVKLMSAPYVAIQDTAVGRAAKVVRTIVDPLHAMDLKMPGRATNIDLMSDVSSRAYVQAHGPINHLQLLESMRDVTTDGGMYDRFVQNIAIYTANMTRRVVGNKLRQAILGSGDQSLITRMVSSLPDEALGGAMASQKRGIIDDITEEAQRFRLRNWDEDALTNLSNRMEKFYGTKDAAEWRTWLDEMKPNTPGGADKLSMLHASTYGQGTQMLLDAIAVAQREGSGMSDKLHKMVLLNRDSLTRLGGDGIISRITGATDEAEAIAELRAAQKQYPELRYFTFEPLDASNSLDRFVEFMRRKGDSLPMQVTNDEIATLHPRLQELNDSIEGAYTLGFRPDDEYLWGLERANIAEGGYSPIGDVWVDHVGVADAGPGYRAGHYLNLNFAGQPIIGDLGRALVKPVDYIDAMGRVMTARVSGTLIAEAARSKFIARGAKDFGLADSEANSIFEGLLNLTSMNSTVANPRGLSASNMWLGTRDLLPKRLVGKFTQRDLLTMVLDAYDGDIRFIGATQKLTARAKSVVGSTTGVNFLGEISEHLYPLIKFRLNAIFQVQEKIEPWVLNAQRGAQVAIGTKMSPADVVTQRQLENMVNHSLVRMGDADQFEFSAAILHDGSIARVGAARGTKLNKLREFGVALTDVQGVKRINMLRTFRKGLGKELKEVWEAHSPGVWDDMKMEAQRKLNSVIHDDDFAVQVMGEHLMGNDIVVNRILKAGGGADFKADFKAALAPGVWASPQHTGEMKALELDNVANLLSFPTKDGKLARSSGDLRAAIAAGDIELDDVSNALRNSGADADYVRRVENALKFSWTGFWDRVGERFNLLPGERRGLENMMAGAADQRGLTPVDYISQIYSPNVVGGQETAVGSMGQAIEVMRAGKLRTESDLAVLSAPMKDGEFVGTRDDLVRQLSQVFSAHLDPSAKRALLMEFRPELQKQVYDGNLQLDMQDLSNMWDANADNDLAKQIMGYMDSTEGDYFEANLPRTAEEYAARWPIKPTIVTGVTGKRLRVTERIGKGLAAADPEMRDQVIVALSRMQSQFPEVPMAHIDVKPWDFLQKMDEEAGPGTMALTVGTSKERGAILLSGDYFGDNWKTTWSEYQARHANFPSRETIPSGEPRLSDLGAPIAAADTPIGTVRHEFGHVLMEYMDAMSPTGGKTAVKEVKRFAEFNRFATDFYDSPAARQLSEYANDAKHEALAELFSVAFDPEADLSRWPGMAPADAFDEVGPQTVPDAVEELRRILTDNGMLKELPTPSANPDVVRATRMFGKWTEAAVNQGLLRGADSQFSGILNDIARIPTEGAVPFNYTEAALIQGATESMTRKWEDAFRLQYFAQRRSMLERSVNHPMFGIYPASYMWGKIMPEIVRFIAKSPFGVRTGAAAYTMADIQKAVAVQREFDPEFDAMVEKVGHSQVMWFLGYLLPSVPWDVGAAFPAFWRDLSQQGLDAQAVVDSGGAATQPDLFQAGKKIGAVIDPMRALNQVHSVADELVKQEPAVATEAPVKPQYGQPGYSDSGPTQGLDLGPTLEEQMRSLKDILSD